MFDSLTIYMFYSIIHLTAMDKGGVAGAKWPPSTYTQNKTRFSIFSILEALREKKDREGGGLKCHGYEIY